MRETQRDLNAVSDVNQEIEPREIERNNAINHFNQEIGNGKRAEALDA